MGRWFRSKAEPFEGEVGPDDSKDEKRGFRLSVPRSRWDRAVHATVATGGSAGAGAGVAAGRDEALERSLGTRKGKYMCIRGLR